jgi:hypothetical protein
MFRARVRSQHEILSHHDRASISIVARTNDALKIKGYKEAAPDKAV